MLLLSHCLMTLTAQALLSLSFLACAPLQQASIFVAEEEQIVFLTMMITIEQTDVKAMLLMCYLPASFCFLNSPFAL